MMYFLRKLFLHSPGHYIIALILAVLVGAFRFSTLPEGIDIGYTWYEVLSVSGYFTFLIGGLLTVSYFGAFDFFGYAFSPARFGDHRKYKDYVHYSEQRLEKRAKGGYFFVPYYVVGIAVVLISRLFA